MEKKSKITQYRERLDKTLASPDLKNEERLKTLVKDQLLHSTKDETKGYIFPRLFLLTSLKKLCCMLPYLNMNY